MSQPDTHLNKYPSRYKIYRIPEEIIRHGSQNKLLADFMITKAGYFPKAYGHEVQRDSYSRFLIIYCLDGQGWFRSEKKYWDIGKGQVAFVLPDTAHGYGAINGNPWTIQWAVFQGAHAPSLLQLIGVSRENPVLSIGEQLNITILFQDILSALQSGYSLHYLLNASTCLQQILSNIAILTSYTSASGNIDINVEQTIKYMLKNITTSCTLNEFAEHACLSPSYFSYRFRQKTGYPPMDYFIRLKIQKACELLETTDWQISKISSYLDYNDQFYFSRIFKKIMDVSPTQYRARREIRSLKSKSR